MRIPHHEHIRGIRDGALLEVPPGFGLSGGNDQGNRQFDMPCPMQLAA